MHLQDISSAPVPTLSFEFFPPRSVEAGRELEKAAALLAAWQPAFASVTYGAGGTTRELTQALVARLRHTPGFATVPHLTCAGHTEADIMSLLEHYAETGVNSLLALRGDPPRGASSSPQGDFAFAVDLVRCIRRFNERGGHPHPHGFGIAVAGFPEGHPGTPNRMLEMDHLKAKVDAGADCIITQACFDNHDLLDFRDRCGLAGIRVPIIAGILPLTQPASLRRMAELAGGTRYPAHLLRSFQRAGDDAEAFRRIGIHHATSQCAVLLDEGIAGIHFYTLNRAEPTIEILTDLGLTPGRSW